MLKNVGCVEMNLHSLIEDIIVGGVVMFFVILVRRTVFLWTNTRNFTNLGLKAGFFV